MLKNCPQISVRIHAENCPQISVRIHAQFWLVLDAHNFSKYSCGKISTFSSKDSCPILTSFRCPQIQWGFMDFMRKSCRQISVMIYVQFSLALDVHKVTKDLAENCRQINFRKDFCPILTSVRCLHRFTYSNAYLHRLTHTSHLPTYRHKHLPSNRQLLTHTSTYLHRHLHTHTPVNTYTHI